MKNDKIVFIRPEEKLFRSYFCFKTLSFLLDIENEFVFTGEINE